MWYEKREKLATQTARLIVKAEDFPPEKGELEKRVKQMSGNQNVEVLDWHERKNADGETFYEIDIR